MQSFMHLAVQPSNAYEPIPPAALAGSLVDRFEQQVARYSDRLAVKARDEALTYGEMNRLANRLARTLAHLITTDSEPVILILSPTARVPAAMFGALKAGHYFIPLDPTNPPARLATLIHDAQARIVITDREAYDVAMQAVGDDVHSILSIDDLDQNLPTENLDLAIAPAQPALRYYTSGTTGQPRGWTSAHHQVLDAAGDNTDLLHITADDCFSHVVSYSFAASRKVLFDALLNGASVAVRDLKTEGFAGLDAWLTREGVTIFCATPSLFRHFVSTLEPDSQAPLRLIFMTGEPVRQHDLVLFRRYFPQTDSNGCLFVNMFGATETGAICQFMLDAQTEVDGPVIPVGYPVHGNTVLLLDETGNTVVEGEVGELCVTGPHAAPNEARPGDIANTAFERLQDGMWVYRTGDLGRLRPDGLYEHLGRRDFQLKINGQRVEPAEVEEALLQHEVISGVVVVVLEAPGGQDAGGETRLVAYLVGDTLPAPAQLRQFLAERLPSYMIPSLFIRIEAIPLGLTGKVDRAALPLPDWSQRAPEISTLVEPTTWIETRLVALWAQVLGVGEISIHDNFFDLGGSSLLAARMLTTIEREFGKIISLASLEIHGTVATLAALITETEADKPRSIVVAVKPSGTHMPLFCIPAGWGYTLDFFTLARHLHPEQPVYAFQQRGLDGMVPPHASLTEMATEYIEEMRAIQPEGPYFIAGRSFGGLVAYEMGQQLAAVGACVGRVIMFDTDFITPERRRKPLHNSYWVFLLKTVYQLITAFRQPPGRWRAALYEVYSVWKKRTRRKFWQTPELRIKRLNSTFFRSYVVKPFPGRIVFFTARVSRTKPDQREALWGQMALEGIDIIDVPGDHVSMLQEPHVPVLAARMNDYLHESPNQT